MLPTVTMESLVKTNNSACEPQTCNPNVPKDWILACQVFAVFLSVMGTVGNSITLVVFIVQVYLGRKQRNCALHPNSRSHRVSSRNTRWQPKIKLTSYVLLLAHLSLCDLLYCTINLPLTTWTYSYALDSASVPSQSFCTGAALMRYVIASVEWMTLGLLTAKRCVDINRTRDCHLFRLKTTYILLLTMWGSSCLLHVLPAFSGHYGYNNATYKCITTNCTMKYFFFIAESALPCGLMLVGCFSLIFKMWRNTVDLRRSGFPKEMVKQRFRSMIRSTTLLLCLLLLFLCCVIPICVFNVQMMVTGNVNVPLGIGLYMIYWTQYAVNFMVYAASNKEYRSATKQSLAYIKTGLVGNDSEALRDGRSRRDIVNNAEMPRITVSLVSLSPGLSSKCLKSGFASDSNLLRLAGSSASEERFRSVSESSTLSLSTTSYSGLSHSSTESCLTVHTSVSMEDITISS